MDTNDTAATALDRLRAAGCVFAEDELAVLRSATESPARLLELVDRRAGGEPLEQVVGWADFAGLRVRLRPGVFVPRRRSEHLVATAVRYTAPTATVVDLCCGSGALGAAVAARVPRIRLSAADVDPVAVACARDNLPGRAVYQGDLFEALPAELRGRIDVLLANVPYVPTGHIPLLPAEAREHEPAVALDGGDDGLAVLRRVAAGAVTWLRPGGVMLSEATAAQRAPEAVAAAGLVASAEYDDEYETTVVLGRRPG
jgi:release factor glutamine methyltransferase